MHTPGRSFEIWLNCTAAFIVFLSEFPGGQIMIDRRVTTKLISFNQYRLYPPIFIISAGMILCCRSVPAGSKRRAESPAPPIIRSAFNRDLRFVEVVDRSLRPVLRRESNRKLRRSHRRQPQDLSRNFQPPRRPKTIPSLLQEYCLLSGSS